MHSNASEGFSRRGFLLATAAAVVGTPASAVFGRTGACMLAAEAAWDLEAEIGLAV
jgi:hypothetical protein